MEAVERDRLVRELLDRWSASHPLRRPPTVVWSRRLTASAGRAYPTKALIVLSSKLLDAPQRVEQTLAHEYAHLMAFEASGGRCKPHGREWRAAMASLGYPARRTHDYAACRVAPRRWAYRCLVCGAEILRVRRLPRGRRYLHAGCGGPIDPRPVRLPDVTP